MLAVVLEIEDNQLINHIEHQKVLKINIKHIYII